MSTIRADNIGSSTGGSTRSLMRGVAAAWVNFNGTGTIAIRDSENVSSLTDNGTGDYQIGFTSEMSDANYAATISSTKILNDVQNATEGPGKVSSHTTTSLRAITMFHVINISYSPHDSQMVSIAVNH